MTLRTLIRRSLRFHWRAHLGVVLGAAVGSARSSAHSSGRFGAGKPSSPGAPPARQRLRGMETGDVSSWRIWRGGYS